MARQEITVYTDDVTGEQGDNIHPVLVVGGDGIAYQVDMGETTFAAYEAAIAPYVNVGRRVGRMPKAASGNLGSVIPIGRASERTETRPDKEQNKVVREWWRRNQGQDGIPDVNEFGRIPQTVQDAFQKHGGRSIVPAPIETPAVKPTQTKRAARTVGAEVHVNGPAFVAPGDAPVKAARTRTAKVESKPPAKRTGRRVAAS